MTDDDEDLPVNIIVPPDVNSSSSFSPIDAPSMSPSILATTDIPITAAPTEAIDTVVETTGTSSPTDNATMPEEEEEPERKPATVDDSSTPAFVPTESTDPPEAAPPAPVDASSSSSGNNNFILSIVVAVTAGAVATVLL